jgi:hypothetical protein
MPVSAADQARELLGLREFEAAEELIERGLLQGAAWALVAAAQAALLLLHGELLLLLLLLLLGAGVAPLLMWLLHHPYRLFVCCNAAAMVSVLQDEHCLPAAVSCARVGLPACRVSV